MTAPFKLQQLATGVPGLDTVLGGGLPELSFNLIAGTPGCGKTTLAHQIMFALATPERPALYFTVLGESPLKMMRYQQQFAFFDHAAINSAVRFVNLSDVAATGDLALLLRSIATEVENFGPALVFVDSFRSVVLARASDAAMGLQEFVQQLGLLMSGWQATTFLIGEYASDVDANPVFTVADGVLCLSQSVQRNSMVRKLEISKMRGQASLPGLHSFRIGPDGVTVFAPVAPGALIAPPADAKKATDARIGMGVEHLDDMMGGGLPRGYSVLVAGPSGSGKSVLATAFLAEGARCGETGVLAIFERQPNALGSSVVAGLVADGRVAVVNAGAVDLSMDEVLYLILGEIRRTGATRVVIDSLSGFELALAPTFRADFRESLARMVTALASTGASVMMTSELEDRYTDLRFSPYGTAFLTDAIIVQRYIEVESQLLRVMAVVKVRASAHSADLRQFTIDAGGLRIGDRLPMQEGLLGGRPTDRSNAPHARATPPTRLSTGPQ